MGALNHHFSHYEYPTIKNFPKNSHFRCFGGMFGSLMRKLLQLQLWNIAPKFVLIDWSCTGKNSNSFMSTRHPKWPQSQIFVSYHVTLVGTDLSFLKRMTPNFLGWLLTTLEQLTKCFRALQKNKIFKKCNFRYQKMNFFSLYMMSPSKQNWVQCFTTATGAVCALKNQTFSAKVAVFLENF